MNLSFDFTHEVNGHMVRVTKVGDAVNRFELRIDNRDFMELKANRNNSQKHDRGMYE